jgi:multidrug efflux pump subunit AcrA (membrane-fusion protein)
MIAAHPVITQRTTALLKRSLLAAAICVATPSLAADDADLFKGATVTVLSASKQCFADTVDVSGLLLPREEISIRPERPGLKVAEVLVDAGDNVTAGQILAKLTSPDGTSIQLQATAAGLVSASTAVVGAIASPRGEALFSIISRNEFDFVGQVPTRDLPKLKVDQSAKVKVIGLGDLDAKVRRIASSVEPNSQLGQVVIALNSARRLMTNSYARAVIKTGESCGIALPLTAVLYSSGGTVVQVVRRHRVETRRVEVGLLSGGQVEIREGLNEGDIIVARAGALLREGDAVNPVTVGAEK